MFLAEYENVKDYSYDRYCRYLIDKYGHPEHDFFNPKCKRSSEGLVVHHVKEDEIPGLCDRKVAALFDKSFQAPENLVCCDYLEHLFLHVLIGEKTAGGKNIGLNGAFFHIIPAIKSYYDGEKGRYNDAYYKRLDGCEDVFDLLIGRYNKLIEETNVVFETNAFLYRKMEDALNTKGRALVVLGTGLGKTTTALQYLWTHKCRALVICPNKLIESGWKERYSDWCDTVSFIGLARSYKTQDYTKYGVVIVDEAHHAGYDEQADAGAKIWSKGIKYILDRGVKVIGLTATPERSDAINVGKTLFKDCVCEGKSVEDAIDKGDVYPFSYISALYDAPAIAEEYKDCQSRELVGQLDVAINNTPTLKQIFAENMPAGERKGIIFIKDIADEGKVLEILKDVFPDAEYRAIHSKMPVDEVKTNREWFENTRSGYLLAVNMISEGAHYPGVNTLIMFRRTSSYLVFTQQLGRIITLTKDPDPHAIVFDLVNNVENVVYNSEMVDKNTHSVRKIYEAIKRQAEKSNQIIVKDETRNIVECIRKIKDYNLDRWEDWEDETIIQHYPSEGVLVAKRLPKRNKDTCMARAQALGVISHSELCPRNRQWTEDEDAIIKKYYPTEGSKCLIRLNGRSQRSVYQRANALGVIHTPAVWTEEEDNILKTFYPLEGSKCRYRFDNKTLSTIQARANKLGVYWDRRRWTQEEDEIIRLYYPFEGEQCCQRMQRRTAKEVVSRASKIKVRKLGVSWTKDEDNVLRAFYPKEGRECSTRIPNHSAAACGNRAHELGLYCLTRRWTNEEIEILREYYLNEGRLVSSRLPNKDYGSIKSKAHQLGLKTKVVYFGANNKRVRCVETGIIYPSISDAFRKTHINCIGMACNGKQETAGGYHWEFVDEDKKDD